MVVATSHDMVWWWRLTGTSPKKMVLIPTGVNVEMFRRCSEHEDTEHPCRFTNCRLRRTLIEGEERRRTDQVDGTRDS